MRIFLNCHEMDSEVHRDLHEMGTIVHPQTMQDKHVADDKDYRTLELSPYSFQVIDGGDRDLWLQLRGGSLEWAQAEFLERTLSLDIPGSHGVNPGAAWRLREETWKPFIHQGEFAYTYSERFSQPASVHGKSPSVLSRVISELGEHPDTRQAVLGMWDARTDTWRIGGEARVPCTLHYQFLRRLGKLNAIYTMRSSDFFTHFAYDIWLALELQARVAKEIDVPIGTLTFFTGSLHVYAKDAKENVF